MRRDGGWTIELITPLKWDGKPVRNIDLSPPELAHVVAWQNGDIKSVLGMVSVLCGYPESFLDQLRAPDYERVLFALSGVSPDAIRNSILNKPMTTEQAIREEFEAPPPAPPPEPPKPSVFPETEGPVKTFPPEWSAPKPPPPPIHEDQPFDLQEPKATVKA